MKKYICDILAISVILLTLIASVGWIFHIPILTEFKSGHPTMKPWTIIALVISAVHLMSRSLIQRTYDRYTMLSAVGFSYACILFLFIWTYTVGLLVYFQYEAQKSIIVTAVQESPHNIPSLITILCLTAYGITGFCTKYSWTVGSGLLFVGAVSNIGFFSNIHGMQWIAEPTALCLMLLGSGILYARKSGTHWFVSECRDALKGI